MKALHRWQQQLVPQPQQCPSVDPHYHWVALSLAEEAPKRHWERFDIVHRVLCMGSCRDCQDHFFWRTWEPLGWLKIFESEFEPDRWLTEGIATITALVCALATIDQLLLWKSCFDAILKVVSIEGTNSCETRRQNLHLKLNFEAFLLTPWKLKFFH